MALGPMTSSMPSSTGGFGGGGAASGASQSGGEDMMAQAQQLADKQKGQTMQNASFNDAIRTAAQQGSVLLNASKSQSQ